MSVAACAAIVARGDPARFRAVMAAPPPTRERLFPLYAFNVEIARAPWIASEPGLAEIRLQWWIDALDEIASGAPVRRHEVTGPLAACLAPAQAHTLSRAAEARFGEIGNAGFADTDALRRHLRDSSGGLLEVAAALLGQDDPAPARAAGYALGLANWLIAVPALKAAGKEPLPEDAPAALSALAEEGLAAIDSARAQRIAPAARPAFLVLSGARPALRAARDDPGRILDGRLAPGPLGQSLALAGAVLLGRW